MNYSQIVSLHGMSEARNRDARAVVKVLREQLSVDCGTHDQHPQFRIQFESSFQQQHEEVYLDTPLVSFVHDHMTHFVQTYQPDKQLTVK